MSLVQYSVFIVVLNYRVHSVNLNFRCRILALSVRWTTLPCILVYLVEEMLHVRVSLNVYQIHKVRQLLESALHIVCHLTKSKLQCMAILHFFLLR